MAGAGKERKRVKNRCFKTGKGISSVSLVKIKNQNEFYEGFILTV